MSNDAAGSHAHLRSTPPDSDTESTFALLDRARTGDRAALEQLFARHLKPLQHWASGRLPKWAREIIDTDDLVQDTLLQTFKRIEAFEPRNQLVGDRVRISIDVSAILKK